MIHHQDQRVTLHHADCLSVLAAMPDNSVDSIVTDPPYGLSNTDPKHVTEAIGRWVAGERDYVPEGSGFMSAKWDAFVPPPAVWDECLRVLKPGGHALVFSSSRTTDLMTLALRLAGFEIRDSIAWLYGGAMPKSLDVSKAIDKTASAKRRIIGPGARHNSRAFGNSEGDVDYGTYAGGVPPFTAPATDAAKQWEGWGTGLRPSMELICVARKPFPGTVAACVQEWGTGAINIDACRIGYQSDRDYARNAGFDRSAAASTCFGKGTSGTPLPATTRAGRWPPNVVLDDDTATQLDRETGVLASGGRGGSRSSGFRYGRPWSDQESCIAVAASSGGASRYFPVMKYQAKAPQKERPSYTDATGRKIAHPTVKPLTLMRWLVRLVTQLDGLVLDPFAGSGSTIEAAILEGFRCIGVEQDETYLPLIMTRITRANETLAADTGMFEAQQPVKKGRWPSNVAMDKGTAAQLDQETGERRSAYPGNPSAAANYAGTPCSEDGTVYSVMRGQHAGPSYSDTGGGSRFFPVFDTDEPPLFNIDEAI